MSVNVKLQVTTKHSRKVEKCLEKSVKLGVMTKFSTVMQTVTVAIFTLRV